MSSPLKGKASRNQVVLPQEAVAYLLRLGDSTLLTSPVDPSYRLKPDLAGISLYLTEHHHLFTYIHGNRAQRDPGEDGMTTPTSTLLIHSASSGLGFLH